MIRKYLKFSGFTLLELIVVMSIISLILSFVGPMTIASIKKVKSKEEILEVRNWIKKNSYRSFATNTNAEFTLKDNSIFYSELPESIGVKGLLNNSNTLIEQDKLVNANLNNNLKLEKKFEYLLFNEQKLKVNAFGILEPSIIEIKINNNLIQLIINKDTHVKKD